MPSTILLKRSSTASSVPAAGSLQAGELAVNLADQKLYSKTAGGTVVQVGFGNLTSAMVTTALGFTPYNSTNPSGYITASGSITGSSGSCTGNAATATRWATGRTIALTGDVTGALGYTPANKAGDSFTGSISVTGTITATGDITAYSDASLKTDIATIQNALALVKSLRGVTFTRIDSGNRGIGVIAQELAAVLPEAVQANDDGRLSVAYANLAGLFIEAIKEISLLIEEIKQDNSISNID